MKPYDVIVLGVGGVGAAALLHLARRGARILGIDRFAPGHDLGSSHGETRIIRQAYFEHADYVPLLLRAYELWSDLEARRGEKLYVETGLLQCGPQQGIVVPGVIRSARQHGLSVDPMTAPEAQRRFPQFHIPAEMSTVFERRAGYLLVESCVRAHAAEALRLGAELETASTVEGWRSDGDGFEVSTSRGTRRASSLIVTAGSWAPQLLGDLDLTLEVRRKPLFWLDAPTEFLHTPCFLFETFTGVFYGFPALSGSGLKAAEHSGGERVTDPLAVDRSLHADDLVRVRDFLSRHLPAVGSSCLRHAVCMYTMTQDENFVVDCHPSHPRLVFAAGLSGHGFKFTPVLGEVLSELALDGRTRHAIDFLSLRRFGLGA